MNHPIWRELILRLSDNASEDGIEAIEAHYPQVKIIENSENSGFKANNMGIRSSVADFILLLNSDTIVEGNTISDALQLQRNHRHVGALGL